MTPKQWLGCWKDNPGTGTHLFLFPPSGCPSGIDEEKGLQVKNSTSYFKKLHIDRGASSAMFVHFKRLQQKVGERSHPPLCCSPSWGLATERTLSCPLCTHQGAAVPDSRAEQTYDVWASHRHMWESLKLAFQEPVKFGTLLIMRLHCIYRLMSRVTPEIK